MNKLVFIVVSWLFCESFTMAGPVMSLAKSALSTVDNIFLGSEEVEDIFKQAIIKNDLFLVCHLVKNDPSLLNKKINFGAFLEEENIKTPKQYALDKKDAELVRILNENDKNLFKVISEEIIHNDTTSFCDGTPILDDSDYGSDNEQYISINSDMYCS